MYEAKQIKIPAALFVLGVLFLFTAIYILSGEPPIGLMLEIFGILIVEIACGIVACLLVARWTDAYIGELVPTCVKLAAIFTFPSCVLVLRPDFSGLCLVFVITWVMIWWLFDLEIREVLLFVFMVNILTSIFLKEI